MTIDRSTHYTRKTNDRSPQHKSFEGIKTSQESLLKLGRLMEHASQHDGERNADQEARFDDNLNYVGTATSHSTIYRHTQE